MIKKELRDPLRDLDLLNIISCINRIIYILVFNILKKHISPIVFISIIYLFIYF